MKISRVTQVDSKKMFGLLNKNCKYGAGIIQDESNIQMNDIDSCSKETPEYFEYISVHIKF